MKTFKQTNKLVLTVLTGRCVNKAAPTSDTVFLCTLVDWSSPVWTVCVAAQLIVTGMLTLPVCHRCVYV